MSVYTPPPVERVRASVPLGDRVVDLATRALVVSVVPSPTWARESEVIAAVRAAADAGADLAEVPADPRLLGPSAQAGHLPLIARVTTAPAARAARRAGASLLVVPVEYLADVAASVAPEQGLAGQRPPDPLSACPMAALVRNAQAVRGARSTSWTPVERHEQTDEQIVALDTLHLRGVDLVAETSLALAFGARLVRTNDIRRTRRVMEVMATLLEARR